MRSSARAALALVLLSALAGCGEGDLALSGSIGRTHPLGFQTVEVRRLGASYAVAYLRGPETAARLAYVPAGPIPVGAPIVLDFSARGNAGLSRATSDALSFPPAKDGTLTFSTDPAAAAGAEVRGRFGVQFTSGDTLSGSFAAPLQISDPR
jgi:hypothetical protein